MTRILLTKVQKEILRLVGEFRGLYGPWAIEAAMSALSHGPKHEWSPIINQLTSLEEKGLVRCDESSGTPRFYLTEEGNHLAHRHQYHLRTR
jgi:hypothetical protein